MFKNRISHCGVRLIACRLVFEWPTFSCTESLSFWEISLSIVLTFCRNFTLIKNKSHNVNRFIACQFHLAGIVCPERVRKSFTIFLGYLAWENRERIPKPLYAAIGMVTKGGSSNLAYIRYERRKLVFGSFRKFWTFRVLSYEFSECQRKLA